MRIERLTTAELEELRATIRSEPYGTRHLEARYLATIQHLETTLENYRRSFDTLRTMSGRERSHFAGNALADIERQQGEFSVFL